MVSFSKRLATKFPRSLALVPFETVPLWDRAVWNWQRLFKAYWLPFFMVADIAAGHPCPVLPCEYLTAVPTYLLSEACRVGLQVESASALVCCLDRVRQAFFTVC